MNVVHVAGRSATLAAKPLSDPPPPPTARTGSSEPTPAAKLSRLRGAGHVQAAFSYTHTAELESAGARGRLVDLHA